MGYAVIKNKQTSAPKQVQYATVERFVDYAEELVLNSADPSTPPDAVAEAVAAAKKEAAVDLNRPEYTL